MSPGVAHTSHITLTTLLVLSSFFSVFCYLASGKHRAWLELICIGDSLEVDEYSSASLSRMAQNGTEGSAIYRNARSDILQFFL